MHSNQTGQNTFLVPAIRKYKGTKVVDLSFHISGGMRNIETVISFLINMRTFEPELWTKETGEYFWVLKEKLLEMISLGLSEELTPSDDLVLRIHSRFALEKNLGVKLDPLMFRSRFNRDAHGYYGMKPQLRIPQITERRRKEKYHHVSYIGVGYKDKGAAGDDAVDASPSWQEVATESYEQSARITMLKPYLREKSGSELRTIVLKRSRERWELAVKVDLIQLEDKQRNLFGWKVNRSSARMLPSVFLSEVPERYWNIVFKATGTRSTDGEIFLFQR